MSGKLQKTLSYLLKYRVSKAASVANGAATLLRWYLP